MATKFSPASTAPSNTLEREREGRRDEEGEIEGVIEGIERIERESRENRERIERESRENRERIERESRENRERIERESRGCDWVSYLFHEVQDHASLDHLLFLEYTTRYTEQMLTELEKE